MEHTPLGSLIRKGRIQAGLSAMELATHAGVTESAIRKIESGDSKEPSFRVGVRIARALSVSPESLAGMQATVGANGAALPKVLRTLREHRARLYELGVRHASVFGSVARGEERNDSDIDILIEVPQRGFSLLDLSGVALYLEEALGRSVDIATARAVERDPKLRAALSDNVNAF
ncbi:MAG TPA: nucleotidyltransferase domain-containing protein [Candidatus Dormibacteraeota bacterium]|nr:nucleotidyltransferase domain-containing protein [Candidatus Dormibacteraeota bacterium]